jgi:hypothetical protein
MLPKSEIDQLVAQFDDTVKFHGLLLHGSCAKQYHDTLSDVDLICVMHAVGEGQRQASFLQRSVDLYLGSPTAIRSAFKKITANNRNVLLNAFCHGQILVDRSGVIGTLRDEARFIWNEGPSPIHPRAQRKRLSLLTTGLKRSRRFAARPETSPVSRQIARIFVDQVFREAVWFYCRVHRRWASHLRETMEWLHRDDPEFYRSCEAYLLCEDLPERVALLERLIDSIAEAPGGTE